VSPKDFLFRSVRVSQTPGTTPGRLRQSRSDWLTRSMPGRGVLHLDGDPTQIGELLRDREIGQVELVASAVVTFAS